MMGRQPIYTETDRKLDEQIAAGDYSFTHCERCGRLLYMIYLWSINGERVCVDCFSYALADANRKKKP